MSGIPSPRTAPDGLHQQRATAAAATIADRMRHDGQCAALAAIQRLMEEAR